MGIKTRIHWNKFEKKWTVKTYKGCPREMYILIEGGWETEVKPHQKTNPKAFVVTSDDKVTYLSQAEAFVYKKRTIGPLIYNKSEMVFNVNKGESLLFLPEGAYIIS